MNKLTMTGEEARAIVRGNNEDWDEVSETLTDSSRWSLHYDAIYKHTPSNKFYLFHYRCGATESQDESPFEYDKSVIATEVVQVERLVKVWVPKE